MTAAQRATLEEMLESRMSELSYLLGEVRDETWDAATRREADALRAALGTCGSCKHGDTSQTDDDWCFCVAPSTEPKRFPFMFTLMRVDQRCTGWTAKEGA